MKTKVNFNAESLDSFGVVELNSTEMLSIDGGSRFGDWCQRAWNNICEFFSGFADGFVTRCR